MKLSLIIVTASSALLCGGTILIAIDQIKEAKADAAEWERKYKVADEGFRKMTRLAERQNKAAHEMSGEVMEKLEALQREQARIPHLVSAAKAEGKLEAIRENIDRIASASVKTSAPIAPTPPVVQRYQPVPPVVPAPTPWIPPQRHMQAKLIKDGAVEKWGDNHAMVLHEVERQTESLNTLLELNKFSGNKALLGRAAEKWGSNYSMMVHEFERQTEALQKLNAR